MNVKLLEKLKTRILRNARSQSRLNMKYWGDSTKNGRLDMQIAEPICHTQACLAGETVLEAKVATINRKDGGIRLNPKKAVHSHIMNEAARLLDLTDEQTQKLFKFRSWPYLNGGWPAEFEQQYNAATTSKQRALAAAARIDHFIKTNGAE